MCSPLNFDREFVRVALEQDRKWVDSCRPIFVNAARDERYVLRDPMSLLKHCGASVTSWFDVAVGCCHHGSWSYARAMLEYILTKLELAILTETKLAVL
jgi:hypothetical protein